MEAFVGEIRAVSFNFAPEGWAKCEGQIMMISQYTTLYAAIGNVYGGDGRTNFALPDLRGRSVVGMGHAPGLSMIPQGARIGSEEIQLQSGNIPSHTHTATYGTSSGSTGNNLKLKVGMNGTKKDVAGADCVIAGSGTYTHADISESDIDIDLNLSGLYQSGATNFSELPCISGDTSGFDVESLQIQPNSGGSEPISHRQPIIGMNYIIALEGIFPSRN